jgi:hypothetical protein
MVGIGLMAVSAIGGLVQGFGSGARERAARAEQRKYQRQLESLEKNRQAIIDPFSSITDLSSMVSNPFANLQVATKASEMQAQQSDISLASTLDTLRAGGIGGGGATALAQAALQSKQGIAANIEQQEARNAELRAQGEQQMQQIKMSEAARLQQAQVQGQQFVFGVQEEREMARLDRLQGMSDRYANQAAAFQQSKSAAFGQALGNLSMLGGEIYQGKVDMKIAGVE